MSKNWQLIFVLPNLQIKESIEYDGLALVPPIDKRLNQIKNNCVASRTLLTKFSDAFGKEISPCALIIRKDSLGMIKNPEVVLNFRNVVAISSIIQGIYHFFHSQGSYNAFFADYFELYPMMPSKDNWLIIDTFVMQGFNSPEKFHGQISPRVMFSHWYSDFNQPLKDKLLKLLTKHSKKPNRRSRAVFRSLQVAHQASTILYENYASELDFGSRIGLWVSAFETLVHPGGNKSVGVWDVIDLLGKKVFQDKKLNKKIYRYKQNGRQRGINLIQKLYSQLYMARNAFLHGNVIKDAHKYVWGDKSKMSLMVCAPFLYQVALLVRLSNMKIAIKTGKVTFSQEKFDQYAFEKIMLKNK